jgi:hypothetical protein
MQTGNKIVYVAAAVLALLLVGCTTDDTTSSTDDSATDGSVPEGETATGPAPGVTDDSIKIGIIYVDTEALAAVNLNYDLGDYEAAYGALIDDINADGGIHGRQIEPVFVPIDPTGPAPAEEACVKLTEDEDVFLATGFFLDDAVTCEVGVHATAVAGGTITPERLEQAQAPWITWEPDTDLTEAVIQEMYDRGELDGNVAVFASASDQTALDGQILPLLEELGVEPVEVGIMDAPTDDTAAIQSTVGLISESFQAADADTVLAVGLSASQWPLYTVQDDSYRPTLLFTDLIGATSFATNATVTDTSALEGSLSGDTYGPNQEKYDEESMQDCIAILDAAGVDVPSPDETGDDPSQQQFQAAFYACPDMALIQAWLEAAGEDLNYGTLGAAIDGLEVAIPGDPDARTYGEGDALDGDPTAYLFGWDEEESTFVLDEG